MQARVEKGNRASVKAENDLIRMQQALEEALECEAKARAAYQSCMRDARGGGDPTPTPSQEPFQAPAQYQPPENPSPDDVDHEVM